MASVQEAPTPKIYYYAGHGNDVCDVQTKKPTEDIVPEGCIYVTIEACGKSTAYKDKQATYFRNPNSREALANPERFIETLAQQFGLTVDDIHIHNPGDSYVVANLLPFAYWDDDIHIALALSGLLEKTKMEALQPAVKNMVQVLKKSIPFFTQHGRINKDKGYNLLLRILNKHAHMELLKPMVRRGLSEETKQKYDTLFASMNVLSTEHIQIFIDMLFTSIDIDVLLDMYDASVLPTREQIKSILDKKFPNRTYITPNEMKKFKKGLYDLILLEEFDDIEYMTYLPVTNKNMMKTFPGIHYNMVCRNVAIECEEGAGSRRIASQTYANTKRKKSQTQEGGMPTPVTKKNKKNKVNRNKTLKNIQNTNPQKQKFKLAGVRKEFPGQLIRLYSSSLKENFPGQLLKELNPTEYLKQKQKLQVTKNLKTRRYNYGPRTPPGTPPRRGPGSRGSASSSTTTSSTTSSTTTTTNSTMGSGSGTITASASTTLRKKPNESFANWLKRMGNEW